MRILPFLFFLFLLQCSRPEAETVNIPPQIRKILRQEMQMIEKGMHEIFSHLIRHQFEDAAEISRKIRDSFIMKSKMTESDHEKLEKIMPQAFLELDEKFHRKAGELSEAARKKKGEDAIRLYSELSTACYSCHASYARDSKILNK